MTMATAKTIRWKIRDTHTTGNGPTGKQAAHTMIDAMITQVVFLRFLHSFGTLEIKELAGRSAKDFEAHGEAISIGKTLVVKTAGKLSHEGDTQATDGEIINRCGRKLFAGL